METQAYDGDLALSQCLNRASWLDDARSSSSTASLGGLSTTASEDGHIMDAAPVPLEVTSPVAEVAPASDDPESSVKGKPPLEEDAKNFSVLSFQETG